MEPTDIIEMLASLPGNTEIPNADTLALVLSLMFWTSLKKAHVNQIKWGDVLANEDPIEVNASMSFEVQGERNSWIETLRLTPGLRDTFRAYAASHYSAGHLSDVVFPGFYEMRLNRYFELIRDKGLIQVGYSEFKRLGRSAFIDMMRRGDRPNDQIRHAAARQFGISVRALEGRTSGAGRTARDDEMATLEDAIFRDLLELSEIIGARMAELTCKVSALYAYVDAHGLSNPTWQVDDGGEYVEHELDIPEAYVKRIVEMLTFVLMHGSQLA